jgi:hypothetical protein
VWKIISKFSFETSKLSYYSGNHLIRSLWEREKQITLTK